MSPQLLTPEMLATLADDQGFLELLPYPVLWVAQDYEVRWMNSAARATYSEHSGPCYAISHGRATPCREAGEACAKDRAEATGRWCEVTHAHAHAPGSTAFFRVLALPVTGGGVVEMHVPLGEVLVRDALTQLYRREFWMEIVQQGRALLSRLGQGYALLFIDLDRFKGFNDRYGHIVGDEALARVAEVIRTRSRSCDVAGRFGGEEFVVFLPHATATEAAGVARRLWAAVRALRLAVPGGEAQVTVSVGVHTALAEEPIEQALAMADRALYIAKDQGRDRISWIPE